VEPDIRYARNGGVAIADQVVGEGDADVVYVPDYMSNLVYDWESPHWRSFYVRLARSLRLVLFDKRGTGLSDHGGQFATLETRMEDLRAVLDAVGASAPVVLGANEGCGMAALFAATYPERTRALVLFNPLAGMHEDALREHYEVLADLRERWGTREFSDELHRAGCPPLFESEDDRRRVANELRVGASPAVAYAISRAYAETDLRDVLPAVRVPTLVLYLGSMQEAALEVAALIPSARAVRIPGEGWFGIHIRPEVVDELERFVAGESAQQVPDSVLATLMFTDIVSSTERAAELGDRAWRDLLAKHNAVVRRELARFGGEERDTAGDGFFATFDGPARAIRAAQAIVVGVRAIGLELRAGVHIGECELHEGKLAGVALSVGARIASTAKAGEVLVSSTVRDLVAGSGLRFADRGERELKGTPGTWRLFSALPE
jgi:class 3 adenylate cyclase